MTRQHSSTEAFSETVTQGVDMQSAAIMSSGFNRFAIVRHRTRWPGCPSRTIGRPHEHRSLRTVAQVAAFKRDPLRPRVQKEGGRSAVEPIQRGDERLRFSCRASRLFIASVARAASS
jgi:hypothetical protein